MTLTGLLNVTEQADSPASVRGLECSAECLRCVPRARVSLLARQQQSGMLTINTGDLSAVVSTFLTRF